jgi:cytochrome P450
MLMSRSVSNSRLEPDHKRLRGLVAKVFTPRYIQNLRPSIQQIADTLLDQVQDQGRMDLAQDFAYHLPINVISDILGIPSANSDQIHS